MVRFWGNQGSREIGETLPLPSPATAAGLAPLGWASCSPSTTVTSGSSVTTATDDEAEDKISRLMVPGASLPSLPIEEESVTRFYPETSGEEALLDDVKKSPLNCERYRHLSSSSWTSNGSGGSEDSSSSVSSFMINQDRPVSWMPHLHREVMTRLHNLCRHS